MLLYVMSDLSDRRGGHARPQLLRRAQLELEPRYDLQLTGTKPWIQTIHFTEPARPEAEVRPAKASTVESIEGLHPDLKPLSLPNAELLPQAEIHIRGSRSGQVRKVPGCVAEL